MLEITYIWLHLNVCMYVLVYTAAFIFIITYLPAPCHTHCR